MRFRDLNIIVETWYLFKIAVLFKIILGTYWYDLQYKLIKIKFKSPSGNDQVEMEHQLSSFPDAW